MGLIPHQVVGDLGPVDVPYDGDEQVPVQPLDLGRDDGAEFLRQAGGELPNGDPEPLAELALRLGASFVLMPTSVLPLEDEDATRGAVRALLTPLVTPEHS